jgi:hypothetical protein
MKSYVDSTGQVARVTTSWYRDWKHEENWNQLDQNQRSISSDRYKVLWPKSTGFEKEQKYLLDNHFHCFRNFTDFSSDDFTTSALQMVVVSLIPIYCHWWLCWIDIESNLLTILVLALCLVSVDDTIHFLAQYRQELTNNNWKIKKSVLPP